MEPVRVRVVFDATGQPQLRRGADSVRTITDEVRRLTLIQGEAGRALRLMEADLNRYSQMLHRTTSQGLMFFNSAFERTFSMFTSLAKISFFKLVAELGVVGYSLRNLGRQFLSINEQFGGLEITMRSMFGSVRAARAVRDELAKITIASPLPFKDLADAVRAAAAMPSLAPRFATQIASNDLSNEKGFLRQYVQLLEQLTTFRPDKLTTDAVFALREAISGELRSLVRRFEFPAALLVQSSGKPLDFLKTRPDAVFNALKGALDRLITPEAIRQIVRQPSKLKENIIEQAVQIPLLQVGRAGEKIGERSLYQRILDTGQAILNRFGEFSNVERGAFGPISSAMGKALSELFDKFTSKLDRGFDRFLSSGGSGRFDILGSTRIERAYDMIQRVIEYVSNNFDKFTASIKSVYDTIAPIFKWITDWMLRFGSLIKKAFDFSPWAGLAALGVLRNIPGIFRLIGGYAESGFVRDATALRGAVVGPAMSRAAGIGSALYPGAAQHANVYSGRYTYTQQGMRGFIGRPVDAYSQLWGAARQGGAGVPGAFGGAVAGSLAAMLPGATVGTVAGAATAGGAIVGGLSAILGPVILAILATAAFGAVMDKVAEYFERKKKEKLDADLNRLGLGETSRQSMLYSGEAESSFVRKFSQFIKDVNERPDLAAYKEGARFLSIEVPNVPQSGDLYRHSSASPQSNGPAGNMAFAVGATSLPRTITESLTLSSRTETMDLAGLVERRAKSLGDIQKLVAALAADKFVPQQLDSIQNQLENGTTAPLTVQSSEGAQTVLKALKSFVDGTTETVADLIARHQRSVQHAISFGTPLQDSERAQLDRWKETLQDLSSPAGVIQASTRFDSMKENLKATDISPNFRQIIDESEKAYEAFQEAHDPFRRIVGTFTSDIERLKRLRTLTTQIRDIDQPVDETGVPAVEIAVREQAARVDRIIEEYRQMMAKKVTDKFGKAAEMIERTVLDSEGNKKTELIPFDQFAKEIRDGLFNNILPTIRDSLMVMAQNALHGSVAQAGATAALIIPKQLEALTSATSSVTETVLAQIEELLNVVRDSMEVSMPKADMAPRFAKVMAELRSAPNVEDALTPFDRATVEHARTVAFKSAGDEFVKLYEDLVKQQTPVEAAATLEKMNDLKTWSHKFGVSLGILADKLRESVATMNSARVEKAFETFLGGGIRSDTAQGSEQSALAQQYIARRFGPVFSPDSFGFLSGPAAGKGYVGEFSRESGMIGILTKLEERLRLEISGTTGTDAVSAARRAFSQQELDGVTDALSRFREAIRSSTEELRRSREAESLQALKSVDILGSSGLGVQQSDEAIRELSRRYGVSLKREDLSFLQTSPQSPTETGELLRQSGWFDTMKRRIIPQIEAQITSITDQMQQTGRNDELEQALEKAKSDLREFSLAVEKLGSSFLATEEQFKSARLAKALDAALDPTIQGGSPYGPAQIQDAVDQLMRRYGIKTKPSDFAYLSLPNENGRSGNRTFGREKGAANLLSTEIIPQARQKVTDAEGVTTGARGALIEKATSDLREFERMYNQLLLEMTKGSKDNSFQALERALNAIREMTSPELGYKLGRKGSVDPRVQFQTGRYSQTDPRLAALMDEFDTLTNGKKTLSILPGFNKALQIDTRGFDAVTGQLERQLAFQKQFAHTAKELSTLATTGGFDTEMTSKILDLAAAWHKLADEAERTAESITGRGGALASMTEGFGAVVSQWTATAQNWTNVGQSIAESLSANLSEALLDIAKNAKNAGEAFRQFGAAFAETAARVAMNKTVESLLGVAFSGLASGVGGLSGGTSRTSDGSLAFVPSRQFATGGLLPGVPTGQDNMLIMAGSGEFIVPANVVKKYGVDHFQRYLTGSLPVNSYAMGGMVSSSRISSPAWSGGSATINVPISVTVNGDSSQTQGSGSDSEERGRALARSLQAAVREQLMVEQRQGGILYRGGRR